MSITLVMSTSSLCIIEVVAISLNGMVYSILENEQEVTVTLTLNDTYSEDIVVNVAVGELLGGYARELYCANSGGS